MDTKTTLSISEARKRIFEIAQNVQKPDTYYILTENGRPKVALMSAEEFESWRETCEVMRDFPDLNKDIEEVERDIKSGAYKNYPTLEEIFAKEGYILADKAKRTYDIAHRPQSKRGKSARSHSSKKA